MVIHRKDNSWVSYSAGWFCKDVADAVTNPSIGQQFSDRVTGGGQNFSIASQDSHSVRVRNSDGAIIVTNNTWSFTTTLTNTSCSGNLITASNASEFYLISFGALESYTEC